MRNSAYKCQRQYKHRQKIQMMEGAENHVTSAEELIHENVKNEQIPKCQ